LYHFGAQISSNCAIFALIFRKDDTMKLEKLPSGSYRIRKTYKGTTYTVVFDHKPTQKEITQALAAEMDKEPVKKNRMTFETAALQYIDVKSNVLSPSTVNGYESVVRNLSEGFKAKLVNDITAIDVQKEINDYSVNRSSKTVRNAHGFISAVLGMFCPNTIISTTLPQKVKSAQYTPSDDDVKRILEYAKGSNYEIPLLLATFGLRRSEICALNLEDLDGNTLTINKALVVNKDKEFVVKTTKTTEGTREIYIPDYLADLIREKGYIYKGFPGNILKYLNRTQDALGIPRFKLHALRHYYASMSHSIGIPDSYIMQAGGWKSDTTLKRVYRHAMEDKVIDMQKMAANYIQQIAGI
jgi:integrase